jgi:hypothetical protein
MKPKKATRLSGKPESIRAAQFKAACLWYQMEFANHSFEAVRDVARDLIDKKLNESAPEYYAITVGLVCIYARPFTNNRPVGKLSDEIVPAYFKDFHDSILTVRHRLFAHADVSAMIGEDYPNEVLIKNDGKTISILTARAVLKPDQIERLIPLVKELIEKTNYHRIKHAKQFARPLSKLGKGEFRLNVIDPTAPIFVKLSEAQKIARQKRIDVKRLP